MAASTSCRFGFGRARRRGAAGVAVVCGLLLAGLSVAVAAPGGVNWTNAGGDLRNTRFQASESRLKVANVGSLVEKWEFTTGGDVSATPAVFGRHLYVPDAAGNLYALDARTGAPEWVVDIPTATGVAGTTVSSTPAVTDGYVIVGTQRSAPGPSGASILAFSRSTGELLWRTEADPHEAAIVTQSPTVFDGTIYVGVASQEELLSVLPGSQLTFRGSMLAIDLVTGRILWKTYTAPLGFTGNAVTGSSPAIDVKRRQVLIATGNNYSVPDDVLACVEAAGDDPGAKAACLPGDDLFDSIVALDLDTGAVRWVTRTLPYDAWTYDCYPFLGDGDLCPDPAGPGYAFDQAPSLFTAKGKGGTSVDVVGVGQTSGQYWALDAASGQVLWVTAVGPGGSVGEATSGSAVDRTRVYTADANAKAVPWTLPSGTTVTSGAWSGLDARTGQILWQTVPPHGGWPAGSVTTANGITFGCSLDPDGYMYALDGATGAVLWEFASGGSCLSGPAISNGNVYWGSGYSDLGYGTANNKLYAFGLPS